MSFLHIFILFIMIVILGLVCFVIFLKIKQKEIALVLYTVAVCMCALITYSIFSMMYELGVKAELGKLSYSRNLRAETLIITGKVTNKGTRTLDKCYMRLSIVNKKGAGGEVFDNQNLKKAQMKNTSVSYVIQIANNLPGRTFRDFNVEVPYPQSFSSPEFYHTLECY